MRHIVNIQRAGYHCDRAIVTGPHGQRRKYRNVAGFRQALQAPNRTLRRTNFDEGATGTVAEAIADRQHALIMRQIVNIQRTSHHCDSEEPPASDELPEARRVSESLDIPAKACKYVQLLPFMHFPSVKNLHTAVW